MPDGVGADADHGGGIIGEREEPDQGGGLILHQITDWVSVDVLLLDSMYGLRLHMLKPRLTTSTSMPDIDTIQEITWQFI